MRYGLCDGSALQCVAVCCSVAIACADRNGRHLRVCDVVCVIAVYCSVLQCVTVCCSVVIARANQKQYKSARMRCGLCNYSVLQCVAACYSVLQCSDCMCESETVKICAYAMWLV